MDVGESSPGRTDSAPSHLTLCFLGEVSPDRNGSIALRLRAIAEESVPFALRLEGVGAFPSRARPRVVWIGATTGRDELVVLAQRVQAALEPEAGPSAGEFVPHLTLFRVRSPVDRRTAEELLAGVRPAPPPRDVVVRELLLKESVLRASGATHRTLEAFPLGQPAPHGEPTDSVPSDATSPYRG